MSDTYIRKQFVLDLLEALKPDASEYDVGEVMTRDEFYKSTYWAARDMWDNIYSAIYHTKGVTIHEA